MTTKYNIPPMLARSVFVHDAERLQNVSERNTPMEMEVLLMDAMTAMIKKLASGLGILYLGKDESSGTAWVGVHGIDSMCVVTRRQDLEGTRVSCPLIRYRPYDVFFQFRKSLIVQIEDMGFKRWWKSVRAKQVASRIVEAQLMEFSWRPRPLTLLTREQEEEISKNLEVYKAKYEKEDEAVLLRLIEQEQERRRVLNDEWDRLMTEWRRQHEAEKVERLRLLGGVESDEEEEEIEEAIDVEVEEEVSVMEEVLLD